MRDTIIILNQRSFLSVAPKLLVDTNGWAIGVANERQTPHGHELVVTNWQRVQDIPRGQEFPPFATFAVMTTRPSAIDNLETFIEPFQLRPSQTVILILLDRNDRGRLSIRVGDSKALHRPTEVRLIGPKLIRIADDAMRIEDQSVRASRTRGALGPLYDKVNSLSTVLVGAGRGASELARQLVATGVRRLTIIDHDRLGHENLDAMPHTTPYHVGELKAELLSSALHANQPDLSVSQITNSVNTSKALNYLDRTRADTVFSFVDNSAARLSTTLKCQQGEMIHVDVGTLITRGADGERIMQADVRLFEPRLGCVACVPAMSLEEPLYELSAPIGAMQRGAATSWDQERAGSLLHLNSLASAIAVESWLGYLSGSVKSSMWTRIRWTEGRTPEFATAPVTAGEDCPFCNTHEETRATHSK